MGKKIEGEFNWTATYPVDDIQEAYTHDSVLLSGVILRLNIPTTNGNIYRVEEAEQIVENMKGVPVFFRSDQQGYHIRRPDSYVGRVVKVENMGSYLRADVEVWNTKEFPDLAYRVKKGWGFSIGGKAHAFESTGTFTPAMKPIAKLHGMAANHLQLLEPEERRGDAMAVVDKIYEVQESFIVDPCPWGICDVSEAQIGKDGKVDAPKGLKREGDETCLFERVDKLEGMLKDMIDLMKDDDEDENESSTKKVKKKGVTIVVEGLGDKDKIVKG